MIYQKKIVASRDTLAKVRNYNGVILFGTGNLGKIVLKALENAKINIVAIADNNESNWNKTWGGYKVLSNTQLEDTKNKYPVIIASFNFPYMKRQLEEIGITNFFDSDFLFSEFELDLRKCETNWSPARCKEQLDLYIYSINAPREKNNIYLNSIDLVLTEKCSLKCKDCSNLMQYYAKPIDEDYNELMESLDRFLSTVKFVREIRLIGGEPLIYKKVDSVIKKLLTYKNFETIHVYTNGTIVLKDEKMKCFQNEKILFKISNYGEISRNVSRLENVLKNLNIKYITERVKTWQDCAKIEKFNRSANLNKHIFGNCCENQGLTLLHGVLYLCPFNAHAENLEAIPKHEEDRIVIKELTNEEIREKLRGLYFKTEFLKACDFCNGRDHNVSKVEAAVQTKKPLTYSKIT